MGDVGVGMEVEAMTDRICYECKHCFWISSTRAYSDLTPGDPGEMGCDKKHWREYIQDGSTLELSDLAKNILLAETCADFSAAPWAREKKP